MVEEKKVPKVAPNVKSVIAVTLPYEKGTNEYENAIYNLGEFSAYNSFEIGIQECEKCDSCGAINRTVEEVTGHLLCDYCHASAYRKP